MAKKGGIDKSLLAALTRSYTLRAILFHRELRQRGIGRLIAEINSVPSGDLKWNLKRLGISLSAFQRVAAIGTSPHLVFAHPDVLASRPHLVAYYRNSATIPNKAMGQVLFSTARYESGAAKAMSAYDASRLCRVINTILSGVIEALPDYQVQESRDAILAEVGSEIQGTWANWVGQRASVAVENLIWNHIESHHLGHRAARRQYALNNGWSIVYGSEPDVAFFDVKGVKRIAIEIKGSLDVAGAQTRYGEARKSFGKQLAENPRCHTIYLASCFTDAVVRQIRSDGQVRAWYNLTSILSDKREQFRFLLQLFHVIDTPA